MILQPTLVVVLGAQYQELPPRILRWFERQAQDAVKILCAESDDTDAHTIEAALAELRSEHALKELTRNHYLPENWHFNQIKVLIICDASDLAGLTNARQQIAASLEKQAFGEAVIPSFWVIAIGPDTIEEIPAVDSSFQSVFTTSQGCIVFHILPFWRNAPLRPDSLAAIAERLAVHLLKMDSSSDMEMVQLLSPTNRFLWLTGFEGHILHEVDETVREAISAALLRHMWTFFRAEGCSPAVMNRLVLEAIPTFERDAGLNADSDFARTAYERYFRYYIPSLLEKLATCARDPEDLLSLLNDLDAMTSKRGGATVDTVHLAAFLVSAPVAFPRWAPFYGGLTVALIAAGLLAWGLWRWLKGKAGPPQGPQPLPYNELFTRALREVIASLSGIERTNPNGLPCPVLLRYIIINPILAVETPVVSDRVTVRKVDAALVASAEQRMIHASLTFSQILSSHWLRGHLAPANQISDQLLPNWHEELRNEVVDEFVQDARKKHQEIRPADYQSFLFGPKPPQQEFKIFELADPQKKPQHPGWYPCNWIHYLYLVRA
jgi:hypothetical protein